MDFSQVKAITIPEGNVLRILSGTTVLWERTGLPTEYQQVEYLESTGTQYIDTGIYPALSDGLYAKFQYISGDLNNYRPFGGYNPGVAIDSVTGLRIWALNNFSINPTNKITDGNVHTIQCSDDGTWDYDGETVLTSKPIQDQTGVTITLFKANYIGNVLYGTGTSRMYDFQYFRNGEAIRNFVPCYRKIDNKPGLYDLVNGVFYTNAGTGEFTVGPDVIVLPDEYQKVEYIESSGTQCIDTGLKLSNASNVYIKYQYVAGTVSGRVIGDATNANTKWLISCSGTIPTTSVQFGLDGQWVPAGGGLPTPNYDVVEARAVGPALSVTVNGVTGTATYSGASFTTTNNASLFRAGSGFAWCRIYRCQIDNTRDFIPCYRKIDNKPGLYDLVNDVFYTNAGTGSFAVGPDV